MRGIAINPGAGPVEGSTLKHASENVKHFIADCPAKNLRCVRLPEEDGAGRFGFLVWKDTHCHEVEMPGLPLDKVRFMAEPGKNPFDYPRLYVDGSSWLWCFALLHEEDFRGD